MAVPPGLPGPVVDLIRTMGAPAVEARPAGMEAVVRALDELPVELRAGPPNGQSRGLSPGEPRGQSRGEPRTAGSPTRRSGLHALLPPLFPLLLLLGLSAAVSGDHPAPPGAVANRSVPSDPQEMRAGMDALRRFDEDGAVARATAHFRTVVDRSPRHAAAWAALAIAHCISHRNDGHDESLLQQAREAARRAVMLDGQLALAQAAEGWALEVQGDRSSAMTRYERALRLDPDNVYALNGQVRLLMAQDKFEAALELASAARERHADDRTFIDLLGWLHFEHGDMAAAEREFRASIQTQPDAVFAYANLNATLLRLGRPEEALQVLQRGLQIRPAGRLYTNLGNALYARGDYAAAAAAFQAAADGPHGSPNFYLRWANLADALLWTPGERPASTAAYRRAWQLFQPTLTRDPSPANVSRAALYQARLGMLAEAAASLSSLQARPPDRADPNFRMALAQEALGQRALALQSLRRALSLGYPAALVKTEPAFAALREDPGFASLLPVPHQPPTGDTRP
ncbi:tetratricopeptide repeat protein [Roseateles chitinivorans]|uniref:tetratricopeptide repeat protein n=1 Tax=Roseateles chitinivorans TaxID=2917965 RepID=UPI003D67396E